ncbi:DUF1206 domain-containing protein [Laspinema olomoucense]|uniref:DUF1206 domain-containing protein n=1 Tax=Laspinema olomoucense TaxID=3231600 RepID=UPI0021BB8B6D|nr:MULTISPECIES: DUF1206 domain-containing protein [unclassified Laspinema]MCT7988706.1 DUF1206 domain-containing protein [Laspinema sp. D3a]MCT7992720.1 DUF1206 domain-containing protein [Laspinema sp. D3c]
MTQSTQSEWIERFARFGYAAKGFVYGLVGILALQAAFTKGGQTTDPKGVLSTIIEQPFGQALLFFVTLGLMGYAMWRFLQAFMDADHKGTALKGLIERFGFGMSAVIYSGFAFTAIKLLMGNEASSREQSDQSAQHWTARFLSQPFGEWLVGLAGAVVMGVGFYYFYKAFTGKFRKELNIREMTPQEEKWVMRAGRVGLSARGVIFVMIGWFLMQAAYQSDAKEAKALPGTLEALLSQPYGSWLLGIVAVGLVIYGLYMGVHARYQRIRPPQADPRQVLNLGK